MKNVFGKISIRYKQLGIITVTLLIVSLFNFTYFPRQYKKQNLNNISELTYRTAEMIALSTGISMHLLDFSSIQQAINWARQDPEVAYLGIFDEEGNRIGELNPNRLDFDVSSYLQRRSIFQENEILYTSVPIRHKGKTHGSLLLGMSLANLNRSIADYQQNTLYISIVILLLGILVSIAMSNLISKPLIELTEATREIAHGKYEIRVNVGAEDEIGTLADSFNRMAENLNSSIGQNQKIIEGSLDGIIVIDSKGIILIWNPSAERTFGWKAEEVIGKPVHDLIIPERYRQDSIAGIKRIFETNEGVFLNKPIETSAIHREGHEFPVELCIVPSTHEGQTVFHGFIRDIKERKEAERQILKAKEEAEKANNAKSDFLARMSHEFRTPMNAILGFTQLLEMDTRDPLVDRQKVNLERISSAGNHLLELINEVLDLSEIESGNLKLNIEPVEITSLVDNIISMSKPLADKNNISLQRKHIPEGRNYCDIDALKFRQVVLNLVSNAIKYNKPSGSVVVSFEEQEEGKMMRLGIKDTGHGIPEEKAESLFKPFDRFDQDAAHIEGTGIGLSITKKLIEMMDGKIGFESQWGKGSFFYIDIPVSKTLPVPAGEKSDSQSTQPLTLNTQNNRILYIEDIPANVELVKQIFLDASHLDLLSAPDGQRGIDLAQSCNPDLILLDMHLPDMDGLMVFEKLQAIEKLRHIPIIALTADAMDQDIRKAMAMGFHSYVTKPINVAEFLKVVNDVMENIQWGSHFPKANS